MLPDPASALPAPPAPSKARLRFRKVGILRFLSHHDLMRTFERMLRRARIPFRTTQGFHPKPRLVFALSLPLGVVGMEEVVEIELDEPIAADELHRRLAAEAPPGLEILSARLIEFRAGAQVRRLVYRVPLTLEQASDLQPRLEAFLAQDECWVERSRPPQRRVDMRPMVHDLRLASIDSAYFLEIALNLIEAGTGRPDELLRLLGLPESVESGAVVERCRLEIHDEIPPPAPDADAFATASSTGTDEAFSRS